MATNRRAQTRKTHSSNSRKDFRPDEKRIKGTGTPRNPKYRGQWSDM